MRSAPVLWLLCWVALPLTTNILEAQQQPFVERVKVARVLIDVRVFDDRWQPVRGLEPEDFEVKIGGKAVRVESAEWIGGSSGAQYQGSAQPLSKDTQPEGRLVVLLVQKDLEAVRIIGLMKMVQLVDPLLAELTSNDRVAVLSFDSHLKIWSDFTADYDSVRSLLREEVLLKAPPRVEAASGVSLVSRLDQAAAKKLYGIEHALRAIGEALEPLAGAKSIVFLGYGFGRFSGSTGGVILMDGYDEASAVLQRARVALFSLNVTQANYNSLQAGLQVVAGETGGFYASTYEFPQRALARVTHALSGHYVLFVDEPDLEAGEHGIEVRLREKKGSVFARERYLRK